MYVSVDLHVVAASSTVQVSHDAEKEESSFFFGCCVLSSGAKLDGATCAWMTNRRQMCCSQLHLYQISFIWENIVVFCHNSCLSLCYCHVIWTTANKKTSSMERFQHACDAPKVSQTRSQRKCDTHVPLNNARWIIKQHSELLHSRVLWTLWLTVGLTANWVRLSIWFTVVSFFAFFRIGTNKQKKNNEKRAETWFARFLTRSLSGHIRNLRAIPFWWKPIERVDGNTDTYSKIVEQTKAHPPVNFVENTLSISARLCKTPPLWNLWMAISH